MAQIERPMLSAQNTQRWHRSEAQTLLRSVKRYTQFVSLSKLALGTMSLVLISTIVILPMLHADKEGLRLAFSSVQEQNESLPMMSNPTFQGVDEENQPYFVTADSALQHDGQTIILANVQADMLTNEQSWLSVKANKGNINNAAKMMQLTDKVRLYHQDGYEFRTPYVDIDMQARIARGSEPVEGFGPLGEIAANSFYWDHDAAILRFKGDVRVRIMRQ